MASKKRPGRAKGGGRKAGRSKTAPRKKATSRTTSAKKSVAKVAQAAGARVTAWTQLLTALAGKAGTATREAFDRIRKRIEPAKKGKKPARATPAALADRARTATREALGGVRDRAVAAVKKVKSTARKTTSAPPPPQREFQPPVILDDVIEEPLLDASGVMRVTDKLVRAQRDGDPNPRRALEDPSLILGRSEASGSSKSHRPAPGESSPRLPSLFEAEQSSARRTRARKTDDSTGSSLFGSLGRDEKSARTQVEDPEDPEEY